jgi:hypothetical protein
MASYADERHWYGPEGWPRLRGALGKLSLIFLPDLLSDLANGTTEPVDAARTLVGRMVDTIGVITDKAVDEDLAMALATVNLNTTSGLWAYALPMLVEIDHIARAIARSAPALKAPAQNRTHAPEAILRSVLNQCLEDARRAFEPGSVDRRKEWERIDRASRAVASGAVSGPLADRLSDAHLEAVRHQLGEKGKDRAKNAPSLGTLRAYFEEFCELSQAELDWQQIDELGKLEADTAMTPPELHHCLRNLRAHSAEEHEALSVKFGLDAENLPTAEVYRVRQGLTRHAYEKLCRSAMAFMQDCFERTLSFFKKGMRS